MTLARHTHLAWLLLAALVACSDEGEEEPAGAAAASTGAGAGDAAGPSSTGAGTGGGGGEGPAIDIPGLEGTVSAVTDEHGVLHLTCSTDDDCFAALGWFHAQNRFFFMDFIRNLVRGSLGSLVKAGPIVLERDYENRRFFTTREGEPLEQAFYDQATEPVRGHFDAYTRGVNAWIEDMREGENGATLTIEYDFNLIVKEAIRDWEPADSAAVGIYVLNDLSNNSPEEVELGEVMPLFDAALGADLFATDPVFDAFTAPLGGGEAVTPPLLGAGHRHLAAAAPLFARAKEGLRRVGLGGAHRAPGDSGSNNWVVGPGRSASGNPVFANDPHLALTNPSIWFPVEIDARSEGEGQYHVAGGTFPGMPTVLIGHNEDVAWGVTTAYWDLADVYVEELTPDGSAVIFDGDEVPILEKEFEFADVLTGEPQVQTFRWVPHHGPIVEEDLDAGVAVSVRWRGHDGGNDLDAFFAVGRATSVEEARDGLAEFGGSANQNFVIADRDGNIGWFPFSRVPTRPWASPALPAYLPLPGDGTAEWGDHVPFDEVPQLLNPAAGVIATANQDMTGATADGDPTNDGQDALQAWGKAEGTRQQRILDLLAEGGDEHTPDTLTAIQGDTFSLYGELFTPMILEAVEGADLAPEAGAVVAALEAWDLTCPTGVDGIDPVADADVEDAAVADAAIGCTAFHVTLVALREAAFADELAAADPTLDLEGSSLLASAALRVMARSLIEPEAVGVGDTFWDDVSTDAPETRDMAVVSALERAGEALAAIGEPNAWRWGRHHTLTLRSIYDNFGVTDYNEGPYASPGGLHTVNVANPRLRLLPEEEGALDLFHTNGASIRLVTEVTPDGPRMQIQLPGGSDLHRESEFHDNLLPLWLVNEPTDFAFGPGAVEDPSSTVLLRDGG